MIRVSASVNRSGLLVSLEAFGHAGAGVSGSDPVCAAVSFILRTYGRFAEAQSGLKYDFQAEKPGNYCLTIREIPQGIAERWRGVSSLVLLGLSDLSRDFPENINFKITEVLLEVCHGT